MKEENMTAEEKLAQIKTGLRINGIITGGSILGIGGFLLWAMTTLVGVQSAHAQTQAQVDGGNVRLTKVEQTAADLNARLGAVERSTIRSEVMSEQIVVRLGMLPPPKITTDGGQ